MYLAMKFLHVAAAVLFVGNVVTGIYWKVSADRAGDSSVVAATLDALARSERWFTLPSAAVLLATGVWLARETGLPLIGTPWLAASIALMAASGLVFALLVAPLQRRLRAIAHEHRGAEYRRISRRWDMAGAASMLASLAVLVLMVIRP